MTDNRHTPRTLSYAQQALLERYPPDTAPGFYMERWDRQYGLSTGFAVLAVRLAQTGRVRVWIRTPIRRMAQRMQVRVKAVDTLMPYNAADLIVACKPPRRVRDQDKRPLFVLIDHLLIDPNLRYDVPTTPLNNTVIIAAIIPSTVAGINTAAFAACLLNPRRDAQTASWMPTNHREWPIEFRTITTTMLMLRRRDNESTGGPVALLSRDVLFLVFKALAEHYRFVIKDQPHVH